MTPLKKILFITSHDQDDSVGLQRAVALAKSNQASLTLASILRIPPGYNLLLNAHTGFRGLMESEKALVRESLDAQCEELQRESDLEVSTQVLTGKMDYEVAAAVIRDGYDMVIKSSEAPDGPKRSHVLFGSADINLMRYCPCPVLITKPVFKPSLDVIVAAVDRDDESPENHLLNLRILEFAAWLAIADSSKLHIVHTWRMPFESLLRSPRSHFTHEEVDLMEQEEQQDRENWILDLISEFSEKHPKEMEYLEPHLYAIKGYASRDIPAKARELDADLIVMGTVGRVGVPGVLMGNTSESILQQVECSSLTVKPPGFTSSIPS